MLGNVKSIDTAQNQFTRFLRLHKMEPLGPCQSILFQVCCGIPLAHELQLSLICIDVVCLAFERYG